MRGSTVINDSEVNQVVSEIPVLGDLVPIPSAVLPRAFLHKRNTHSGIYTTVGELLQSHPRQPMFGFWGGKGMGRYECFVSLSGFFFSVSF